MRLFGKILLCFFAVLGLIAVATLAFKGIDNLNTEPTKEVETPAEDEKLETEDNAEVDDNEDAEADTE